MDLLLDKCFGICNSLSTEKCKQKLPVQSSVLVPWTICRLASEPLLQGLLASTFLRCIDDVPLFNLLYSIINYYQLLFINLLIIIINYYNYSFLIDLCGFLLVSHKSFWKGVNILTCFRSNGFSSLMLILTRDTRIQ